MFLAEMYGRWEPLDAMQWPKRKGKRKRIQRIKEEYE